MTTTRNHFKSIATWPLRRLSLRLPLSQRPTRVPQAATNRTMECILQPFGTDPTKSHSNLAVSGSRGDRKPPTPTLGRIGLPVHDILGRSKTRGPASHPHVHDHGVWEPANVCKSSHAEDSPPVVKGIQEDDAFLFAAPQGIFHVPAHKLCGSRNFSPALSHSF